MRVIRPYNNIFNFKFNVDIIELLWAEIKRYVRKRPCRTAGDLVYRIQKFFRFKLDVAKCRAYICHLRKVLQIIIDRRGDWSDC